MEKQRIIDRIEQRARALGINIEIKPEELTYQKLIEISDMLYIDHLRLLSPNYKKLNIKFRQGVINNKTKSAIKLAEEIVHILDANKKIEKCLIDTEKFNKTYEKEKRNIGSENIAIYIADLLRKEYNLGQDPINLFEFCYRANINILILKQDTTSLEGAFLRMEDNCVVLVKKNYIPRMNFTLAHEIGHLLMHINKEVEIDEENYINSENDEEKEANNFAAELIVPSTIIQKSLKNIELLKNYCISKEAIENAFKYKMKKEIKLDRFTPKCANDSYYDSIYAYSLNRKIKENIELFIDKKIAEIEQTYEL